MRIVIALAVVSVSAAAFAASEPPPGAASCTGCHPNSISIDTPIPRLAARPAAELVEQMQAFKTGKRPATVMDRIAKGYTDAELAAIAAWYAEQK